MAITGQVLHNGIRARLRRFGWHHPEWWVVTVAAGGWLLMAAMPHPQAGHAGITPVRSDGLFAVAMAAMVIAMMLPLTLANVRHVARSSLWRRRHQAIAAFLVGYLVVWFVVQAAIVQTWALLAPLTGWKIAGGVAVVAAALWETAPIKRRRLRRCQRTVPLAPRGWRANADCAGYGMTTAFSCVTTCWALMVVAVAFSHSLAVMAILFGVQVGGRYQQRPSPLLGILALAGVCVLSFAAGSPHHLHH